MVPVLENSDRESLRPLRANRPDVIDETFDGEVTIIHLGTGLFYGLNASASAVWSCIRDGRRSAAVIAMLSESLGMPASELEAPIIELVDQFCSWGLLVACDEEAPAPDPAALTAWSAPQVQEFSDMQDLLLLDPVHDIELDERGWPIPRVQQGEIAPN